MENSIALQKHQRFMQHAIFLAEQARDEEEIPVGAIVIHQDQIIGKGYNQTESLGDATAHAEMIALSAAMASLESKYLKDCTLYVTLEPCVMCTGALVWSKIDRVVLALPMRKVAPVALPLTFQGIKGSIIRSKLSREF